MQIYEIRKKLNSFNFEGNTLNSYFDVVGDSAVTPTLRNTHIQVFIHTSTPLIIDLSQLQI